MTATAIATLTIGTFFVSSLLAELNGNGTTIQQVKKGILYVIPVLFIAMPVMGISGNKIAGASPNHLVRQKQKRMKFIFINGMILTALAMTLYYLSHYKSIDHVFLSVQMAEFLFGLINLTLIGLNIHNGLQLSGRLNKN